MDKWANDAIYTKDGSKLISIPKSLISFKIKEDTKIIGGNAFKNCSSSRSVVILNSVSGAWLFFFAIDYYSQ